jgi:dienelactone hydrolase
MRRMKTFIVALVLALFTGIAKAEIKGQPIEYRQGETVCEGQLVYDDAASGKRPGVLVAHQWKGLIAYEKRRAEMLARLGYVVFCADIYGKGVRVDNPQDAASAVEVPNPLEERGSFAANSTRVDLVVYSAF